MEYFLPSNLKFLRKMRKLSQAALGNHLDIPRSNIAAYESKGVEPSLAILQKLSAYFEIDIQSLITKDLSIHENLDLGVSFYKDQKQIMTFELDQVQIDEYINSTIQCRKILQGFLSMHTFNNKRLSYPTLEAKKLRSNVKSLFNLIKQLLSNSENIIQILIKNVSNE